MGDGSARLQPAMLFLCLPPLVALAAHGEPPSSAAAGSIDIASFGWYWAMEDGGGNATAFNERNCSAPGPCSWDHANVDFVQVRSRHGRWPLVPGMPRHSNHA